MKKATGKKLTLEKLNITKLEQMSSIKGGLTSREPGCDVFNETKIYCKTKNENCNTKARGCESGGTTIIQWG
ncbi:MULTISPECIES: hypothetical protein [Aquimarina]|uniref:hypothetical protein n=1 Tax=Aquimarina TaxID=290174 RepID=UPI00135AB1BF|nr:MULTISPECIES: hypothetical protein [Aquimarina]